MLLKMELYLKLISGLILIIIACWYLWYFKKNYKKKTVHGGVRGAVIALIVGIFLILNHFDMFNKY